MDSEEQKIIRNLRSQMEDELEKLKEKRRKEKTMDMSLMSIRSELIEEIDLMLEQVHCDLQQPSQHQLFTQLQGYIQQLNTLQQEQQTLTLSLLQKEWQAFQHKLHNNHYNNNNNNNIHVKLDPQFQKEFRSLLANHLLVSQNVQHSKPIINTNQPSHQQHDDWQPYPDIQQQQHIHPPVHHLQQQQHIHHSPMHHHMQQQQHIHHMQQQQHIHHMQQQQHIHHMQQQQHIHHPPMHHNQYLHHPPPQHFHHPPPINVTRSVCSLQQQCQQQQCQQQCQQQQCCMNSNRSRSRSESPIQPIIIEKGKDHTQQLASQQSQINNLQAQLNAQPPAPHVKVPVQITIPQQQYTQQLSLPLQISQHIQPTHTSTSTNTIIQPSHLQSIQPLQNVQQLQPLQTVQQLQPLQTVQQVQQLQPLQTVQQIQPLQTVQQIQPLQTVQQVQPLQSMTTITQPQAQVITRTNPHQIINNQSYNLTSSRSATPHSILKKSRVVSQEKLINSRTNFQHLVSSPKNIQNHLSFGHDHQSSKETFLNNNNNVQPRINYSNSQIIKQQDNKNPLQ